MSDTPKSFEECKRCNGTGSVPERHFPESLTRRRACPDCDRGRVASLTPQTAPVPARQDGDEWKRLEVDATHAERFGNVLSVAPRTILRLIAAARQDAAPEKDRFDQMDEDMWKETCERLQADNDSLRAQLASLPTQTAVGEGELPKPPELHGDDPDTCYCRGVLWDYYCKIRIVYREAIAQRDEAKEEVSVLQALLRTNGAALATAINQKLEAEAKLAALDVPKPEEIERLKTEIASCEKSLEKRFRGLLNGVDVDWIPLQEHLDELKARLRSLPSEPQIETRKAVENEVA